ncbi:MAG: DUF3164 family protein [Paludibacteraceae bacterium]|nr:DUF3164 family protein [Paludibacteraceae bacterium]
MDQQKTTVEMTAEELELFNEAKAAKAKKDAAEKKAEEIKTYKSMVDEAVNATVIEARTLNEQITNLKEGILGRFKAIIDMKEDLFRDKKNMAREGRFTDTFTNSESSVRVTLGYCTKDAYDDTYTAGVDMVHEYIESLASDDKSRQLTQMVNTLLSERSKGGQLKAQNVLRLEQMASESGDEKFIEGMKVIREAYRPAKSKVFVTVEVKDDNNEWRSISMNMTNCGK